jgi:uncharacterized protein (DUF3084 family)
MLDTTEVAKLDALLAEIKAARTQREQASETLRAAAEAHDQAMSRYEAAWNAWRDYGAWQSGAAAPLHDPRPAP